MPHSHMNLDQLVKNAQMIVKRGFAVSSFRFPKHSFRDDQDRIVTVIVSYQPTSCVMDMIEEFVTVSDFPHLGDFYRQAPL